VRPARPPHAALPRRPQLSPKRTEPSRAGICTREVLGGAVPHPYSYLALFSPLTCLGRSSILDSNASRVCGNK
jgi:hypothetical protein